MSEPIKRVLMYGNRKEDPTLYDVSTPELAAYAWLNLFRHLDENWDCYQLGEEDAPILEIPPAIAASNDPDRVLERGKLERQYKRELAEFNAQRDLYIQAKAGNARAAEQLLRLRNDYEYEEWTIYPVESR